MCAAHTRSCLLGKHQMTAVAVAVFLLNVSSLAHSCLLHIMQVDDPLDAIAVHAFNGTWGVWADGLFGANHLINTSYGYNPYTNGSRNYGCFMGGNGRLLAAQIVYSIWLGGMHKDLQWHACQKPTLWVWCFMKCSCHAVV